MKKSLFLSIALGLGLCANAETTWQQVTSADELVDGGRYKIAAHYTGWDADRYLTLRDNNSMWLPEADLTDEAEAIWTFEAHDRVCNSTAHVQDAPSFYLVNNGRYFNKGEWGPNTGAELATFDAPKSSGCGVVEFIPSTRLVDSEGIHSFEMHVLIASWSKVFVAVQGTQGICGGSTDDVEELNWYPGTNNYTSHFVVYKEAGDAEGPTEEPTYTRMDRTGWTVTGCSEFNGDTNHNGSNDGGYVDLFDDNTATYWHSHWQNDKAAANHFFVVDFGTESAVDGIGYLPRQAGSKKGNGYVQDAEVYVVSDIADLTCGSNGTSHTSLTSFLAGKTPAWTGNLASVPDGDECTAYFDATATGRYLIFRILSTQGEENSWAATGNQHANCAEFYVYQKENAGETPVDPDPVPADVNYGAFTISGGTTGAWKSVRIDDSILGSHNHGSLDDTDLRSRDLTYSAWIRPRANGTLMGIKPDNFRNNQGTVRLFLSGSRLGWVGRMATTALDAFTTVGEDYLEYTVDFNEPEWMFLTLVANKDDKTIKLYVNGELLDTADGAQYDLGTIGLLADENCTFYIGEDNPNMDVEQVQIWTKALTAEEVKDSYYMDHTYTVADDSLKGFYFATDGEELGMVNLGTSDVPAEVAVYQNGTMWGWLQTETKTQANTLVSIEGVDPHKIATPEPVVEGTEYTWEYTFTSKNNLNADGETELEGATWITPKLSDLYEGLTYNFGNGKGIQLGTSAKPVGIESTGAFTLTSPTFGAEEIVKITKVELVAGGTSGIAGTVAVKIGDTAFTGIKTEEDTPAEQVSLKGNAVETITFTGEATGAVTISYEQTTSKAFYLGSIKITYETTGNEIKAREVVDVEFENITALIEANNTFDNVILKNPVTVTHRNNTNIFVQDATGALQLFGVSKDYVAGTTLTGIKGKYTVYNTYTPEVTGWTVDTEAEGEAPEANLLTAALTTDDANKYVKFTGATVVADEAANMYTATVGNVTYSIFNSWGIDMTEGVNVTLTGIVNVTSTGLCRIYPISCEEVEIPVVEYAAFNLPAGGAGSFYTVRIDDDLLGEHVNGKNYPDETDLRSRAYTYSAWIRPQTAGILMGYIPGDFASNRGVFQVTLADNKIKFVGRNTSDGSNGSLTYAAVDPVSNDPGTALGEWVFISVVSDPENGKCTLYKNGHAISSYDVQYGAGLPDENLKFYIGDQGCGMDLEQIQVWTKALTPAEIRESYFLTPDSPVADELKGFFVATNGTNMVNLGKMSNVVAHYQEGGSNTSWYTAYVLRQDNLTIEANVEGHTPAEVTVAIDTVEGASLSLVDGEGNAIDATTFPIFTEVAVKAVVSEDYEIESISLTDVYGTKTIEANTLFTLEANATISAVVTSTAVTPSTYTVTVNTVDGQFDYEIADATETYAEGQDVLVIFTRKNADAKVIALRENGTDVTSKLEVGEEEGSFEYYIPYMNKDVVLDLESGLFYTVTINTNAEHFTAQIENADVDYEAGSDIRILFTRVHEKAYMKSVMHDENEVLDKVEAAAAGAAHHFEYYIPSLTGHTVINVTSDIESGIFEISVDGNDTVIYDLQGRRVSRTPAGLYIINGQKVIR